MCEPAKEIKPKEAPEPCYGTYTISQGYRKVPGNTCVGGENFHPLQIKCPTSWAFFSFKTLLFFIAIGVGCYFGLPYLRDAGLLDKFLNVKGPSRQGYKKDFSEGGDLDLNAEDDEEDGIIRLGDPRRPEKRGASRPSDNDEGGLLADEEELPDIKPSEQELAELKQKRDGLSTAAENIPKLSKPQ